MKSDWIRGPSALVLGLLLIVGAGRAFAQATAEDAADVPEPVTKGKVATLIEDLRIKWKMGGPTMYPLAFVGLVGLVFVVDRSLSLSRKKIVPHGLADAANKLWLDGKYDEIVALAKKSNSSLGNCIAFIVRHRRNDFNVLTSAVEDIAGREFESHSRRNYPLSAVGTISPLLGLMGTVFGLMGAFASIGAYGSMDDPSVLAGDIGEAMVTTAAGLIVAVPALGFYHYFRTRASEFAGLLGEEVSNIMQAWFLTTEDGDANPDA